MTRIAVASELALAAVCDPSVDLPSGADPALLLRQLDPLLRGGKVFYFVADDPVRYRIELVAGERPTGSFERDFEPSAVRSASICRPAESASTGGAATASRFWPARSMRRAAARFYRSSPAGRSTPRATRKT